MSDNAAIISNHLTALQARAESLKSEAEGYLGDLRASALNNFVLATPPLDFTLPNVALSTEETEVTANLASGLQYPDASSALASILADNYDSDFLVYLENATRNTPLAAWSTAILSIRDVYRDGVTSQAGAFVAGMAFPTEYLAAGAAIIADAQARHDTDFAYKWGAFLNDTAVQITQEQAAAGLSIEEIRARSVIELAGSFDAYSRALLSKGQTDFEATLARIGQIQDHIELRIQQQILAADQAFTLDNLTSKKELLALDGWMVEAADTIRRNHTEFALEFNKAASLVEYMKSALTQAQLSAGAFTINTSTSEE